MSKLTPVTLYVKPFVKKFILRNYGKEPVYVRADSDVGILFRLAIARDNYLPIDEFEVEESFSTKKDDKDIRLEKIKFALSFRVTQGKMTHENLKRMTVALENEFDKALFFYVKGMRFSHVSESRAVKSFLTEFGLEDEEKYGLKLAAAIKIVQRARREKEVFAEL